MTVRSRLLTRAPPGGWRAVPQTRLDSTATGDTRAPAARSMARHARCWMVRVPGWLTSPSHAERRYMTARSATPSPADPTRQQAASRTSAPRPSPGRSQSRFLYQPVPVTSTAARQGLGARGLLHREVILDLACRSSGGRREGLHLVRRAAMPNGGAPLSPERAFDLSGTSNSTPYLLGRGRRLAIVTTEGRFQPRAEDRKIRWRQFLY